MVKVQEWIENKYPNKEITTNIVFNNFGAGELEFSQGELIISNYPRLKEITTMGEKDIKGITKVTINNCPWLKKVNTTCFVDNEKLNISNCPKLEILYCKSNQLTNLNISNFPQLKELGCSLNKITELDLTNCPRLEKLWCAGNQLTSLNVSNLENLEFLYCQQNQLARLNLDSNNQLTELYCDNNQLTSLDLTGLENLEHLECHENQLTQLNLSENKELVILYCLKNELSALDLTNCSLLKELKCWENQLTSLNVSNCQQLKWLGCGTNKLTNLEMGNLENLEYLDCQQNKLRKLDLSSNKQLSYIGCGKNKLTQLIFPDKLSNLQKLDCNENKLTELVLPNGLDNLQKLNCWNNRLTNLSFLENLNTQTLEWLALSENNFPSQDLKIFASFRELKDLYIAGIERPGVYFMGSLEPLRGLTKLERLDIRRTDISHGLEYLSKSVKEIMCNFISEEKVRKIVDQLRNYKKSDFIYDFQAWRKDNEELIEKLEREELVEKLESKHPKLAEKLKTYNLIQEKEKRLVSLRNDYKKKAHHYYDNIEKKLDDMLEIEEVISREEQGSRYLSPHLREKGKKVRQEIVDETKGILTLKEVDNFCQLQAEIVKMKINIEKFDKEEKTIINNIHQGIYAGGNVNLESFEMKDIEIEMQLESLQKQQSQIQVEPK